MIFSKCYRHSYVSTEQLIMVFRFRPDDQAPNL